VNNKCIVFLMFILLFPTLSFSQPVAPFTDFATTDSGKRVILYNDGTWKYIKSESQKDFRFDFRNSKWGMGIDKVKETEESPVLYEGWNDVDDATVLNYKEKVFLYECHITFLFDDNKLFQGRYVFEPENEEDSLYLHDFEKITEALITKYGDPAEEKKQWSDSLYMLKEYKWGTAVRMGKLSYISVWETKRSIITLDLFGKDNNIVLELLYRDKKYYPDEL
jgi:hypothetical protein